MPSITLNRERFSKFVGRELPLADMTKWLPWLGFDIEEVGETSLKVEFNPNRIDFSSYVGIARAFKGLRGWKVGLPKYKVKKGTVVLEVDAPVSEVRPYILGAVVRNVDLEEESITDLMEIQEDLHWGIGRNREKASIGVHDLDAVRPPFTFTAVEPNSVSFIPLDKTQEMTLDEVLKSHEKGIAYRHLVEGSDRFPLLVDRSENVLSMPPIINGELTRIGLRTKNLFLDVTGTSYVAVEKSLNVLSTALADMGGTIETVKVRYNDRTVFSPDLRPQKMILRTETANELLGLKLADSRIVECLQKGRLGAKKTRKGVIEAMIPAYRIDILHEVDLVEEVAVGYGYYKLRPTFPSSVTIGKQHQVCITADAARQIMIGLSFTEVMNFTLTNENLQHTKMRRRGGKVVALANPISSEYTIVRQDLLPSLMKNLAENKHESFPQRLFEVSDAVRLNPRTETECERRLHIAAVSSHATANFTSIKSVVEAFAANMGLKRWTIKPAEQPSFLSGRAAAISTKAKDLGMFGEIHPAVLNNFELENPVVAFEIDLQSLVH